MQGIKSKTQLIILACSPFVMALVADGVQVKISNETTQDLIVTVYDLSAQPQKVLLQNSHINGFTSVVVNAIGDATGRANLSWSATNSDALSPKCGHGEVRGLANNSTTTVQADSTCSAPTSSD
jgi:hypothetical protein